jgi:pyruvate,orthophosphate dikinase
MPGMMETILNLGLNDRTVQGLAQQSGNPRFAFDSYRRFLQMYGDVVLGVPVHDFEHLLKAKRLMTGSQTDAELDEETLRNLVEEYKALIRNTTGSDFPMDVQAQLWGAIEAVWKSWTLKKAVDYRKVNAIPEDSGTAVNIVAMVYGNMGDDSGTGVAFTRDPSTGERKFYGECLINAQGEDVVAGIRTPLHIDELEQKIPGAYADLLRVQDLLERHFRDMQDLEFTVERGTLYLLQTRTGKRTAAAAIRIAGEMVDEGLITSAEAIQRVNPAHLDQLLHPVIDPSRHTPSRSRSDSRPARAPPPASPSSTPMSPSRRRRPGRA